MNKLSHLRFGNVPKLFKGICLMLALIVMLNANAYAQTPQEPTIAEIATDGGFTTLVAALDAAGLTATFADAAAGPFTVFAPTNQAFDALPAGVLDALLADPTGALTDVLQYHVVAGELTSDDLTSLTTNLTTLLGEEIEVSVVNGSLTLTFLNGSSVIVAGDIQASNGIIHVIDAVLIPPAEPLPTIADIAVDGGFTTLVAALDAAGLTATFADPAAGPFTVFAPTDDAFAALPDGVLDQLLADPTGALTDILSYHVVAGTLTADDLTTLSENLTTLLGEEIVVSVVDGSLTLTFLNGTSVILAGDIEASNGIVHIIDTVLIPPSASDSNGNGIPDSAELDKDGDGVIDDSDGDGIPDYLDSDPVDSNGNGIPDSAEYDKDGDGVADDSDGDGIPDYLDTDSGVVDSNGNGIPDSAEYDKDGDGVADDSDGDGIPDYLDTDSGVVDSNGNGIPDSEEYDADGDGIPDDVDGDGIPDWLDDLVPAPSISVLKAVQGSQETVNGTLGTLMLPSLTTGESIVFIIGVENTGNVPLTEVSVTDILPGADATDCENTFPATLDVGGKLTCVVTYVITDEDVNNGEVVNEAVVQSQYEGMVVENSAISVFPSTEPAGSLSLRKFMNRHSNMDDDARVTPTDVLNYIIVATNVGDATLSGVLITDIMPGTSALTCNDQDANSGVGATLEPGESLTCSTQYTVTEQDGMVEEGDEFNIVRNVAYATADAPFAVAVQVDNTPVFPITTAVTLSNTSIPYSATLFIITVAAVALAQLTSYAKRKAS